MVTKIIIADDDEGIRSLLLDAMQIAGFEVYLAADGTEALNLIKAESPDLLILDIEMPRLGGYQVLRQLRKTSKIPVIMISARKAIVDKVESFDLGADDYITKPFELAELIARVNVALRHDSMGTHDNEDFDDGYLHINFKARQIFVEGRAIDLTTKEYNLLRELVLNKDQMLDYRRLLKHIWGPEYETERNLVQVLVRRLRLKIEVNPEKPLYILTIEGAGYRFKTIS
jgi:DNA-binding response OmpR family regulator